MIIEIINLNRVDEGSDLEMILIVNLKDTFIKYEKKLFRSLITKNFKQFEEDLSNFCFELLELNDERQVYVAKIFFSSIVMGLMKNQALKDQLHPEVLSHIFSTVDTIDHFENITEFLSYIPYFSNSINQNIIGSHTVVDSNNNVEVILNLIEKHLKDSFLSVEWLSKQINLSTTHINNLFKENIDQTIGDYIAERRIKEIAFELITTSEPIKAIYTKYGFVNQSHFTQRFRQLKGITPLQYRKNYFQSF